MTRPAVRALLDEAKRRKVFRVAAVYAAAAFVVAQVADIFFSRLQFPEWTVTFVIVLILLGLPLAIGLAWAFDVVPSAGRRREPASGAQEPNGQTPYKSIAVLPFLNMSAGPANEYFSDGITEELINALSNIKELQVAARTSSFVFKNTDSDVQAIGDRLNVGTVLEGSVRKADDRLRITAQLIDVSTGYHIWSGTFDTEVRDVFAIQEDISRSVVNALRVPLGLSSEVSLIRRHTGNLDAYNQYLLGLFHWNWS